MKVLIENYSLLFEKFYSKFVPTEQTKNNIIAFMDAVDLFMKKKNLPPIQNRMDPEDFHVTFIYSEGDEPEAYRSAAAKDRVVQSIQKPLTKSSVLPIKLDPEYPVAFKFGDYMVIKMDANGNNPLFQKFRKTMAQFGTALPAKYKQFRPHLSIAFNTKSSNNKHLTPYQDQIANLLIRYVDKIFIYNTEVIDDRPEDQQIEPKDKQNQVPALAEEEGSVSPPTNNTSNIATTTLPLTDTVLRRKPANKTRRYFISYKYR